jgi:serine protease DegQ
VIVSREGYILTNDSGRGRVTEIQVTSCTTAVSKGKTVGTDPEHPTWRWSHTREQASRPITFGTVLSQARDGRPACSPSATRSRRRADVDEWASSAPGSARFATANPFGSFIQTDARSIPGKLGRRAVRHARANLIGINTLILLALGGYQGIGFAIPVSLAKRVMEQIIETGRSRAAGSASTWPTSPGARRVARAEGHARRHRRRHRARQPRGEERHAAGRRDRRDQRQGRPDVSSALNAIAEMPPGKSVPVKVMRRNQELTST